MAQVTKTFTSSTRAIRVSPDGKSVYATVEWSSGEDRQAPRHLVPVVVRDGRVLVQGKDVAGAPAEAVNAASTLAEAVRNLVETLARENKVTP